MLAVGVDVAVALEARRTVSLWIPLHCRCVDADVDGARPMPLTVLLLMPAVGPVVEMPMPQWIPPVVDAAVLLDARAPEC